MNKNYNYIKLILFPNQTNSHFKKIFIYSLIECAITSIIVIMAFIFGFNLILAFILPLIVYLRDVKIFKENSYILELCDTLDEDKANKIFHLPFFMNIFSLVIIPFLLPQLILFIDESSWSDLIRLSIVKIVENNTFFLSPFIDPTFLSNQISVFGMPLLKGSTTLVFFITIFAVFYFGLLIATIIAFDKKFRQIAISLAKFHIKNENRDKNYYSGMVLFGIAYPLFIIISFFLLRNQDIQITNLIIAEFSLLLLSSFVFQMLTFLFSRCFKVKGK